MRKSTAAAAAAAVLAVLMSAAAPAVAGNAPAAAGTSASAACTPGFTVLPNLPAEDSWTSGAVRAFGAGDLAVGVSNGRPAYWTGGQAHPVPLPEGHTAGWVSGVSATGLMVGVVQRGSDQAQSAFSYRAGQAAVRLLTAPATAGDLTEPKVNASGRIVFGEGGVAKEWVEGGPARVLPAPAGLPAGTLTTSVSGINTRGDVLGTATVRHTDVENDREVTVSNPVVWPAGGYPPQVLQVWTEDDPTVNTVASGLDDKGRVVGYEAESYRDVQRRTPATWKRPYDGQPVNPGLPAGLHATLEAISPTTNVTVGTESTFTEGFASQERPVYWPGSGPLLTLPVTAGWRTTALAVSDDGRVGGRTVDPQTVRSSAVVWTCAGKQAFVPQR
ncbi:hypothetical protein [Streptomyces sp. NPDC012888]|uniref:hypothetical protein n=1 Tax=Streptomyces sp. NPDC012888 TaxID=3364855 RepID=UPI00368B52F8